MWHFCIFLYLIFRTCRQYQKSFLSLTDPEINDEFNSASALVGCQEISGCLTANLVNLIEGIFIGWNNQLRKRSCNYHWQWIKHGESYEWFRKEPQAYDVFSHFLFFDCFREDSKSSPWYSILAGSRCPQIFTVNIQIHVIEALVEF